MLEELSAPLSSMKKTVAALDADTAAKIQSKVTAQFKKEVTDLDRAHDQRIICVRSISYTPRSKATPPVTAFSVARRRMI